MCSKWFKFNCMNSLKMNLNCNYRMNLQDAVYLKFSVASTFQEPPVAKITRLSDAIKYFHLHCLSQDSKLLILSVTEMLMKFGLLSRPTDFYLACFYLRRGTWTVHCSPADHAQAVAQSRHLHRGFREASVCKTQFPQPVAQEGSSVLYFEGGRGNVSY